MHSLCPTNKANKKLGPKSPFWAPSSGDRRFHRADLTNSWMRTLHSGQQIYPQIYQDRRPVVRQRSKTQDYRRRVAVSRNPGDNFSLNSVKLLQMFSTCTQPWHPRKGFEHKPCYSKMHNAVTTECRETNFFLQPALNA